MTSEENFKLYHCQSLALLMGSLIAVIKSAVKRPLVQHLEPWLLPYQPRVDMDTLIQEINRIYHAVDADNYDSDLIEIRQLWPALWAQMLEHLPQRKSWRVIDFGCGTGFAAEQVLRFLGNKVTALMAYDPCERMLDKARKRLGADKRFIITSNESNLLCRAPYDLLITNSVLHHLPNAAKEIFALQPM